MHLCFGAILLITHVLFVSHVEAAGAKTKIEVLVKPDVCKHKTKSGDTATWKYRGTHLDGEQFSEGTYTAVLGKNTMVKGIDQGMYDMCVGEERRLEIPPELGYESQGNKNIYFFNELIELKRDGEVLASNLPALKVEVLKKKHCESPSRDGDVIHWHYKGSLTDGTVFDEGDYFAKLGAGKIIQGVNDGMLDMCVGEERKLIVPPHLGYGDKGTGNIPGGATLIFINSLTKIEPQKTKKRAKEL